MRKRIIFYATLAIIIAISLTLSALIVGCNGGGGGGQDPNIMAPVIEDGWFYTASKDCPHDTPLLAYWNCAEPTFLANCPGNVDFVMELDVYIPNGNLDSVALVITDQNGVTVHDSRMYLETLSVYTTIIVGYWTNQAMIPCGMYTVDLWLTDKNNMQSDVFSFIVNVNTECTAVPASRRNDLKSFEPRRELWGWADMEVLQ